MSHPPRIALVTGGAHRLGRAIALALADTGVHIAIHYHSSSDKAQAILTELHARGVESMHIPGDLSDTNAAEHIVDQVLQRWGRLDILVNNAGIWGPTPIGTVTAEGWDELLNTNLRGAFFVSQRAAKALRASLGCIINIADIGVERPWGNHVPYLVSKGGIVTLTRALARDLAPEVRVNAIAPGTVLMPENYTEEQNRRAAANTLLKRVGSAEDIGQAAVYLSQASYVTGVVLAVDGGASIRG